MSTHPVKVRYSFLKILTGSDLSRRKLPVMSATGAKPGPVVWITACVHGDEVGGIAIVQELFKYLKKGLKRGKVMAFPLMNPIGFETGSRNITISKEDLNRSFPGDPEGSLGNRIANQVFERILSSDPDLVLDLHNDWIHSIPYALIDPRGEAISSETMRTTRVFAHQTGFIVVKDSENLTGSLSYSLLLRGIPALTFEMGEPKIINERNVKYGLGAIKNILREMDMIEDVDDPFLFPLLSFDFRNQEYLYFDRPCTSRSGIVRFLVSVGQRVKQGQPVAKIVNAFGKQIQVLRAKTDGVVLGMTDSAVVFPGMVVMAFAVSEIPQD